MSDGDMVEALEKAINAEPDVYWAMERGQRIPNAALERILSVIEGRVRAEERERAARIAEEYVDPSLADNRDVTIAATSARASIDIAAAIRSGDEG